MRIWRLALITTVTAAVAGTAAAHARLVSATPAPDSVVASPRSVSMTFSGRMVPAFSDFDLVGPGGAGVAVDAAVSKDGKTLSGALARPLAPGVWRVNWRIASADGHRMTGSYSFTVRQE
ncbi:copper homeostasis periplasmic binding protein CopC [Brevundimonas sp.]|uniref:copper homeostasis periplasmic binding protein CopC n=1 Tax=Brevundimonas sp. TaxID=1871086 RepID=UPI002D3A1C97|nr:copper homeostasis periplasmic binding protein CopC [Brevundimonas sp.]HYC73894.1 copper homeostasis periplasmic binding protein CopC [Brevundimonas sp.]